MIHINLLEQETTSGRGAGGPMISGPKSGSLMVAAILIPTFIVILVIGFFVWNANASLEREAARLEQQKNELEREIASREAEYRELTSALLNVENQLAILKILDPEDRLLWARKLNILPMYVPSGVHITNLAVRENVKEVETEESRRRQAEWNRRQDKGDQPPPPVITRPVITQTLDIEGLAYVPEGSSDQRLRLIAEFIENLKNQEVEEPWSGRPVKFIDGFRPNVSFPTVRGNTRDGREVHTFNFTLTSIPVSVDTEPGAES